MILYVTLAAVIFFSSQVVFAQNAKPQGGFAPTDPRGCARQLTNEMRNLQMGSNETLDVVRTPETNKKGDVSQVATPQSGPRQFAWSNYLGCGVTLRQRQIIDVPAMSGSENAIVAQPIPRTTNSR